MSHPNSEVNVVKSEDWRQPPPPIPEELYAQTYQADIVIIGAGQSGTAAARSAAENGASVIVIEAQGEEKQRILGGQIGHINSEFGRQRGVQQYHPIELVREIMRRNQFRPNVELIHQYAYHCGETFDWFISPLTEEQKSHIQIFFNPPPKHMPASVNGAKSFCGTAIMPGGDGSDGKTPYGCSMRETVKLNQQVAREHGTRFFFEMPADQLLKEGERVVGVAAKAADGSYVKFLAGKGVLLAAGDFSANSQMVKDLMPEVDRVCNGAPMRGMGWDGKGIRMGLWAGGRLDPGPIGAEGGNYVPIGGPFGGMFSVAMNRTGKRFCDECNGRVLGKRQPGNEIYFVWDANWRERLEYQAVEHGAADPRSPQTMELLSKIDGARGSGKDGYMVKVPHPPYLPLIYCGETYEELAEYMGFEGEARDNFVETMRRYNQFAYQGCDEDFGKEPAMLKPLDHPPYYGCSMEIKRPHMAVTNGGLWIDEKQRVLDSELDPIPGLFATGNCSGNRFGAEYWPALPGQSIGMCHTLGRIVGRYMAQL